MLNLQIGAGTLYIANKKFLNKAKFAYLKTKTNKRTQGDRLIITLVLFSNLAADEAVAQCFAHINNGTK